MCGTGTTCLRPPSSPNDAPGFRPCVRMTHSVMGRDPHWQGSHSYCGGLLGGLLPPSLGVAWARDGDLSPTLEGALCLLHGDDDEHVLQLLINHVHPTSGGCRKSVKKHGHCSHVLAGSSEGRVLPHGPHSWLMATTTSLA
jgi:hypothetical protein